MRFPNSALRAAFGSALGRAKETTSRLVEYLVSESRAAWVWQPPLEQDLADELSTTLEPLDLRQSVQFATEIINSFWYQDGQDPQNTRICPGLIAVGTEGIALAQLANDARRALAASLAAMEGRVEEVGIDPYNGATVKRPLRDVAQEAFRAARLHYKQATRSIVTLDHAPTYAGFTWANCRKILRTTAGEIRKSMTERLKPESPDHLLLKDLKSLQNYKDSDPLAIVTPASLTPKVNLAWRGTNGTPVRTIKRSVLPLLYVGDALPERLYELPPIPTLPSGRNKRNDVEVEEAPFLATVPAHRYISNSR